jgi:hypothetical protein
MGGKDSLTGISLDPSIMLKKKFYSIFSFMIHTSIVIPCLVGGSQSYGDLEPFIFP